jgi:hypothetical protein
MLGKKLYSFNILLSYILELQLSNKNKAIEK